MRPVLQNSVGQYQEYFATFRRCSRESAIAGFTETNRQDAERKSFAIPGIKLGNVFESNRVTMLTQL